MHTSLKNKHFKLAGVPHYKESDMLPIQILNSIIKAKFDAPMLTNHIQVQVLHPKNRQFDIVPSMKILKQMSMWISTNKSLSAEPTISKRLAEDVTQIMNLSTPDQRRKLRPYITDQFGYQNDVDIKKFEQMCKNETERHAAMYPALLASNKYIKYINDLFSKERTLEFLNKHSPRQTITGHRGDGRFYPPFGITYESLTIVVGTFDKKYQKLDV